MHVLAVLLTGVVIVVAGVLVLRLHAFLALLLAALTVGLLTPAAWSTRYEVLGHSFRISALEGVARFTVKSWQAFPMGQTVHIVRGERGEPFKLIASLAVTAVDPQTKVVQARYDSNYVYAPDDRAILPAAWHAANEFASEPTGKRVGRAFGDTCASIGILIAMAAIIGKCLLDSGAADCIVRRSVRLVGEPNAPRAFLFSGFLLGIPVFFDTVFYLMMPLGKALRLRTGRNYLLYTLAIVAGATMAHSLVPPTPGPLLVARELGVDLGVMIIAGCLVGGCAAVAGYLFATLSNRGYDLPLRETPGFSLAEVQRLAARDDRELPPLWLSLTPILLPVLLITASTLRDSLQWKSPLWLMNAIVLLGEQNVALTLSAIIALATLAWKQRQSLRELAASVEAALASGGTIILITSAGGAFGAMIKQTSIAEWIQVQPGAPITMLTIAFLITTAIRTAQGSATVAMITAVGVLSGFASAEVLGFHPVYLALAIGCGSKPVAWMNDSGFWVICKMSGMTEREALRYITPMSILMGAVGLLATIIGAMLWPLRG